MCCLNHLNATMVLGWEEILCDDLKIFEGRVCSECDLECNGQVHVSVAHLGGRIYRDV